MACDWFLIDAPHVVPAEFQAWESAKNHHCELMFTALMARDVMRDSCDEQLMASALNAKIETDRLEQIARAAWVKLRKLPPA